MTESCANCRFGFTVPWSTETASGTDTYCRWEPPEFVPPNSSTLKPVVASGWCGKWQEPMITTKSVPAPGSDPNSERSSNLSVPIKRKKLIRSGD